MRIAAELGPAARVCELGVENGESLRMWMGSVPLGDVWGVDYAPTATWPEGTWASSATRTTPPSPACSEASSG